MKKSGLKKAIIQQNWIMLVGFAFFLCFMIVQEGRSVSNSEKINYLALRYRAGIVKRVFLFAGIDDSYYLKKWLNNGP